MQILVEEAIKRVSVQLATQGSTFDAITNQLADLLHYCEFHSIDFNDAVEQAKDYVIEDQSHDYYTMSNGK